MSSKGKNKWSVLILIALLLNLIFVVILLVGGMKQGGPPSRQPPTLSLAEKLDFDEQQKSILIERDRIHRENRRRIQGQAKRLRGEMGRLLTQNQLSAELQDSLTTQIGQFQAELEMEVMRHFREIREEICNEGQRAKFNQLISEMLQRDDRPGPGANRPPPPRK